MGSNQAKFDEGSMKEFETTTSLNRYEIYHAFKQFYQVYREYQQSSNDPIQEMVGHGGRINTEVFIPIDMISELPALQVNPFRVRICTIFTANGNGMMSFIEFLDMVSAFSPKNDLQQKSHHAFQIFDIDSDGVISRKDICDMLDILTDRHINDDKKNRIVDEIFDEVNKDSHSDGLSTEDFQYAISRAPDFSSTFSFRL